jgi:hypothetical protein
MTRLPRLHPNRLPEPIHLGKNHPLHLANILHHLKLKIKRRRTIRLIASIMPNMQVSMLQRLFHGNPFTRVERQHAVQKIQGVGVGEAEKAGKGDFLHVGEVADVVLGAGGADAGEGFFGRGAEVVEDLVELVDVVAAFEEGFSAEEFGEDAAYGPDVDCGRGG